MVLITGAGGQVGTAILKALSAHDISTRAWIHRAAQREAVLAAGATEVFVGDMAVREDAEQALVNSELPISVTCKIKLGPVVPRNYLFVSFSMLHRCFCANLLALWPSLNTVLPYVPSGTVAEHVVRVTIER